MAVFVLIMRLIDRILKDAENFSIIEHYITKCKRLEKGLGKKKGD
jgi:hypothetical protein